MEDCGLSRQGVFLFRKSFSFEVTFEHGGAILISGMKVLHRGRSRNVLGMCEEQQGGPCGPSREKHGKASQCRVVGAQGAGGDHVRPYRPVQKFCLLL